MSFLIGVPLVPAMIFAPFAFFWILGQLADLWHWLTRSRVDHVLTVHEQSEKLRAALHAEASRIDPWNLADGERHQDCGCRFWEPEGDRMYFQPCPVHRAGAR